MSEDKKRLGNKSASTKQENGRLIDINQIRSQLLDETVEAAPQVAKTAVWRNTLIDLNLKKVFVRSMIAFFILVLVAQWSYGRYIYQVTQEEGPVPITVAVEQLGTDLPAPPEAPPAPR
ncbi:MAG: hypothetical protein Kow0080_16160 [Candidatus Promineifilaceae bacterium]